MGASALIAGGEPVVEPGNRTTRTVKVRNTGGVVDRFQLDVVGDASGWTTVEPGELSLFPGAEGEATVTFSPPRSSAVRAGVVPYAIRILSHEDTEGSVVEESQIEVAPFVELKAEMVPRTVRAKRRGRSEVAVDNVGNTPVSADLLVEDSEEQVKGSADPPAVVLEPGKATFAKVDVAPSRPFWKGASKTLPYQVTVLPGGGAQAPVFADGVVLQEQILPKWLLKALLALIALLIVLFVLWQTVFKDTIESAAKDAVDKPLAAQEQRIAAVEQKTTGTTSAPPANATTETTAAGGGGLLGLGDSFDKRLVADVKPGQTGGTDFTVEDGKTFSLTDLVLGNSQADTGVVRLKRGGDVLLEVALANFRDLDYHFVSPMVFKEKQKVVLEVRCDNPNPGPNCKPSSYLSGFIK